VACCSLELRPTHPDDSVHRPEDSPWPSVAGQRTFQAQVPTNRWEASVLRRRAERRRGCADPSGCRWTSGYDSSDLDKRALEADLARLAGRRL